MEVEQAEEEKSKLAKSDEKEAEDDVRLSEKTARRGLGLGAVRDSGDRRPCGVEHELCKSSTLCTLREERRKNAAAV